MKKILIWVFLILLVIFMSAKDITNRDRPLKGTWDFDLKKIWETGSAGEDVLVNVTTLRVDDKGNLFVFDVKSSRFHVYSPGGEYLHSFGKRGEGPGEYRMAFNFFLNKNRIIVPDMGKIHYFDLSGKYIKSVTPGGTFIFPRVFIDPDHFIYIPSRPDNARGSDTLELVNLITNQKTRICELQAEEALEATASRQGGQARLNIKDANTTPGVIVGRHDHFLFFGKNDKYVIKKTDLKGKELFSFSLSGRQRNKITQAVKRKRLESITLNGRKIPDDMIRQMMKTMPDQCTHFNHIRVDENGLIYVFVPDLTDKSRQHIDIFSPEGQYLYKTNLTLPGGYRFQIPPHTFKDNFLYVFAEDPDGEVKLVKYQVTLPPG